MNLVENEVGVGLQKVRIVGELLKEDAIGYVRYLGFVSRTAIHSNMIADSFTQLAIRFVCYSLGNHDGS